MKNTTRMLYSRFTDCYGITVGPFIFFSGVCVLGLVIVLGFVLWVLTGERDNTSRDIVSLTYRLKNHEIQAKEDQNRSNIYEKTKKQGFFRQKSLSDFDIVLDECRDRYPDLSVLIETGDPTPLSVVGYPHKMVEVPVVLTVEGNDDREIYDFLELLQKKIPAIASIRSIGFFRDSIESHPGKLPLIRGEVQLVCLFAQVPG